MSNVYRLRATDKIFFITTNLSRGTAELIESEFEMLLQVFSESRTRLGFVLLGYVFMPDHLHALIWPRPPLTISRVLQDMKYCSSRNLNRVRGTAGTVWQHQFSDRFVRAAQEFQQRLEYMHYNPVRKGLVFHPEE
jgi:putative transposase